MKFQLGYPSMEDELKMLSMLQHKHPLESIGEVVSAKEIIACQQAVRTIHVDDKVRQYIMEIIHATRQHEDLTLGASPRGSIALFRGSQAMAALRGRDYVLPDDVKFIVAPIIAHRLILSPESRLRKVTAEQVVEDVVSEIAVPTLNT
jgi:MoxR-like ATPase